jgi:hypothetical protein
MWRCCRVRVLRNGGTTGAPATKLSEASMKFLCLAYGDEDGWNSLDEEAQRAALAQDAVIRQRGNMMAAVQTTVTCVKNWDGKLEVDEGPSAQRQLPLAGFSVIEAENVQEVVRLVSSTPCARARGFIEIRPFLD